MQREPTDIDEAESRISTNQALVSKRGGGFIDSLEPSHPSSLVNVPINNTIQAASFKHIKEEDSDIDRCEDEFNDRMMHSTAKLPLNVKPPQT